MTLAEIQRTQARVGAKPDGFWGPKSIAACRLHLRNLMPSPARFPLQSDVTSFYGPHGQPGGHTPPLKKIKLPFTIYYGQAPVDYLWPHEMCADSLLAVFDRLAAIFKTEADRRHSGVAVYDGLYNPRAMRGGLAWSMHAWAIAIDLDAARNGNLVSWPAGSNMPIEVMECFAAEGWMSAGAEWGRDSMHFQSTSP